LGHAIGACDDYRMNIFQNKKEQIEKTKAVLDSLVLTTHQWNCNGFKVPQSGKFLSASTLLRDFNDIKLAQVIQKWPHLFNSSNQSIFQDLEIDLKYEYCVQKQALDIEMFKRDEGIHLPQEFDYKKISNFYQQKKFKN